MQASAADLARFDPRSTAWVSASSLRSKACTSLPVRVYHCCPRPGVSKLVEPWIAAACSRTHRPAARRTRAWFSGTVPSAFGPTFNNDQDAEVLFRVAAVYRLEPWLDPKNDLAFQFGADG